MDDAAQVQKSGRQFPSRQLTIYWRWLTQRVSRTQNTSEMLLLLLIQPFCYWSAYSEWCLNTAYLKYTSRCFVDGNGQSHKMCGNGLSSVRCMLRCVTNITRCALLHHTVDVHKGCSKPHRAAGADLISRFGLSLGLASEAK